MRKRLDLPSSVLCVMQWLGPYDTCTNTLLVVADGSFPRSPTIKASDMN